MHRAVLLIAQVSLSLLLSASSALAANFPGWTRTYQPDGLLLVSPQDAYGVVQLMLGKVEREDGDPRAAFKKAVDDAVAQLGGDVTLAKRSGLRDQAGMMVELVKVRAEEIDIDLLVFAYDAKDRYYQAGVLAYVSAIAETDKRVNHALDFIATAARARYRLVDPREFDRTAPKAVEVTAYKDSAAPTPSPSPAATPPANGKKCERRPIWGFRVSYWCQPSGICNDRVIKGYETVCE